MAARTTPGKSLTWSVASKCATRRKVFAIVRLLIARAGFTNGWNARANQAPTREVNQSRYYPFIRR